MAKTGKKRLAILGSTGSVGRQTLEVVRSHPGHFSVELLTAYNNHSLLADQAREFLPDAIVIGNERHYQELREALASFPVKVYAGEETISGAIEYGQADLVILATVGMSGLNPLLRSIQLKKTIALANKEALVVAGSLIAQMATENNADVLPVDSEHSAILQCLKGEHHNQIEKVYLTASGGPFRGISPSLLEQVSIESALKHPNWNMGNKVSIDSATLMNKGMEVIGASWLFGLQKDQMEVIIQPQSVIHAMVLFQDGTIKAQMGIPDMRMPIQYALGYPFRMKSEKKKFNPLDFPRLEFERPDTQTFPCLNLAYEALDKGGNMPCVLNAANEIAVEAFLAGTIGFLAIPKIVSHCMNNISHMINPGLQDILETDIETRAMAKSYINSP